MLVHLSGLIGVSKLVSDNVPAHIILMRDMMKLRHLKKEHIR